jgi:hypothetical protein
MRKILFTLIVTLLPQIVFGNVTISEIMYDPEGADADREWIEVHNAGSELVDLSLWKLFEANTNHKLTLVQGSTLGPGSYGVIVGDPMKFKEDYPSYGGLVMDSTFSLGNSGEVFEMRNEAGETVDSVSYLMEWGAAGDGGSLQKIDGKWVSSMPTIGRENVLVVVIPVASTATTSNVTQNTVNNRLSSHSQTVGLSSYSSRVTFEADAGRPRLSAAGSSVQFEAKTKGVSETGRPRFTWSFGDGASVRGEKVNHAYSYPGEYNVVLNAEYGKEMAVAKTHVKVVEPLLMFATATPLFIEIANNSLEEVNLEGWRIVYDDNDRTFIFPMNTIVDKGRRIAIPHTVSGISHETGRFALRDTDNREVASLIVKATPTAVQIEKVKDTLAVAQRELEQLTLPHEAGYNKEVADRAALRINELFLNLISLKRSLE